MKHAVKRLIALSLIAAPLSFFAVQARAEVLERILAVVNDEIISEQDLQLIMAPVISQYRTIYTGAEFEEKVKQARQEFLNKVIEEKLVLSEAKRKQVIVKDEEVEELMADMRNKFPSREFFQKAISEQGLSEKKLTNRIHDQLMTQKLVAYEVKSKVSVSPGEVSDYYKAHPQEFTQDDRIKLLHILIRIGARSEDEAKTFADSIYARLQAGGSFSELAKQYSEGAEAKEGGEMGWIERGQLLGEIDDKVFNLEKDQFTQPIKSSLGFHIFKVVDTQKFAVKPLAEVRDQIQDVIFKEKLKVRLDQWIKDLRKNAYISIR
jgi:parvulin-like peptidyl-prolyl isomerase